MERSSIYLHIPYCKQACSYCDFHFSTQLKSKEAVLQKMREEILDQAAQLPWSYSRLKSIYFGGGTPSILSTQELQSLLLLIEQHFALSTSLEITLEANPDDITPEKLDQWFSIGINRLSVGIQSFNDADLRAMNRAHNATHSLQCLTWISESAFTNYTIDLIYGLPGSSLQSWRDELHKVKEFSPPHLSCYGLTVEQKTALAHQVEKGEVSLPEEDEIIAQFEYLRDWAYRNGYEHYELSNFAKPGFESRHNSHYWSSGIYLGIGPGAHSFNGSERVSNVRNNTAYANGAPQETEELSAREHLNERLMVRLRTAKGFTYDQDMPEGLSSTHLHQLMENVRKQIALGSVFPLPNGFKINPANWMRSDYIISELFVLEE